jgi:hypothetical protein
MILSFILLKIQKYDTNIQLIDKDLMIISYQRTIILFFHTRMNQRK